MDTKNFAKTLADNYTTGTDRYLDAVLSTNRKVVETTVKTIDELVEKLPALPAQVADFTDRFPTAAESGERYLEFVERAVEVNRDFNEKVAKLILEASKNADAAVAKASTAVDDTTKTVTDTVSDTVSDAFAAISKQVPGVKAPARKTAAKKTPAKKAPARKAVTKKAPTRKAVARKAPARKAAASK